MRKSGKILSYVTIRDNIIPITRESDEKDENLARKVVACRKCGLSVQPFSLSERKFAEIVEEHGEKCEGQLEHFYLED